jgi:hypothetical protein
VGEGQRKIGRIKLSDKSVQCVYLVRPEHCLVAFQRIFLFLPAGGQEIMSMRHKTSHHYITFPLVSPNPTFLLTEAWGRSVGGGRERELLESTQTIHPVAPLYYINTLGQGSSFSIQDDPKQFTAK